MKKTIAAKTLTQWGIKMKASKLINELQTMVDKHGDKEVIIDDTDSREFVSVCKIDNNDREKAFQLDLCWRDGNGIVK